MNPRRSISCQAVPGALFSDRRHLGQDGVIGAGVSPRGSISPPLALFFRTEVSSHHSRDADLANDSPPSDISPPCPRLLDGDAMAGPPQLPQPPGCAACPSRGAAVHGGPRGRGGAGGGLQLGLVQRDAHPVRARVSGWRVAVAVSVNATHPPPLYFLTTRDRQQRPAMTLPWEGWDPANEPRLNHALPYCMQAPRPAGLRPEAWPRPPRRHHRAAHLRQGATATYTTSARRFGYPICQSLAFKTVEGRYQPFSSPTLSPLLTGRPVHGGRTRHVTARLCPGLQVGAS